MCNNPKLSDFLQHIKLQYFSAFHIHLYSECMCNSVVHTGNLLHIYNVSGQAKMTLTIKMNKQINQLK